MVKISSHIQLNIATKQSQYNHDLPTEETTYEGET